MRQPHFVNTSAAPLISLRRAREGDVSFLLELRTQTMGQHHAAAGIVQSSADHEARVRAHFASAEIIELNGQPIGLLKVLREPAEWRVAQVQVLPAFQRCGIGSHLIASVVSQAGAAGVPITLSVLKVNPARRLYERLGFKVVSEGEHGLHMRAGG